VDVFDALRSPRPYKPAFPIEKCLELLQNGRGTEFDPTVHDALLRKIADMSVIYAKHGD
jgi:putative two-component system response regulator